MRKARIKCQMKLTEKNFEVKSILGKYGIEVTLRARAKEFPGQDIIAAGHFYDKEKLDDEIKDELIKLCQTQNPKKNCSQ